MHIDKIKFHKKLEEVKKMKRQAIFMAVALTFALAICEAVSASETYHIGVDVTKRACADLDMTNSTSLMMY